MGLHAVRVQLYPGGALIEIDNRLAEHLVLAHVGQHNPAVELLRSQCVPAHLAPRSAPHLEDVGEISGKGQRNARRDGLAEEVEHPHEVVQPTRGDHQLAADAQRLLRYRRQRPPR